MRITRLGPTMVLIAVCLLTACRNDHVDQGAKQQDPPATEQPLVGRHYLILDLGGITYDLTLGDQAFLVEDSSGEKVYSGDVTAVGIGFLKLVVMESALPALRPVGFVMYATELPEALLFLTFASSWNPGVGYERGVLAVNVEGACPSGPADDNLIAMPDAHFDQLNFPAFGAAVIQDPAGGGVFQIDGSAYLLGDDFNASTSLAPVIAEGGFTCSTGSGLSSNDTHGIFLTGSGLALAGLQEVGAMILLPKPSAHPDTVAAEGRAYRGIRQRLHDTQASDQGNGGLILTTEPVRAVGGGSGTLTVQPLGDFESSDLTGAALTAHLAQNTGLQQRSGLFDGGSLDGAPFRATVQTVNGKFILVGMYQWDFDGLGGAGMAAPDWAFVVLVEE